MLLLKDLKGFKMSAGRPKKYKNKEELQKKIDEYFSFCDEKEKPYTICGLALAIDLDRKSLLNYSEDEEFFRTIKKAKQKCEAYAEEQLYLGKNTAGVIFNMKNNYNWKDKTEQELTVEGIEVNINRKSVDVEN